MKKCEMYVENAKILHDVFYNDAMLDCEFDDDKIDFMKNIDKILLLCDKFDLHIIDIHDIDYEKSNLIYDCEKFFIVNNVNEIVAIIDEHFDYYNIVDCEMFYDCDIIVDKNDNEYCMCDNDDVFEYEKYFNSLK